MSGAAVVPPACRPSPIARGIGWKLSSTSFFLRRGLWLLGLLFAVWISSGQAFAQGTACYEYRRSGYQPDSTSYWPWVSSPQTAAQQGLTPSSSYTYYSTLSGSAPNYTYIIYRISVADGTTSQASTVLSLQHQSVQCNNCAEKSGQFYPVWASGSMSTLGACDTSSQCGITFQASGTVVGNGSGTSVGQYVYSGQACSTGQTKPAATTCIAGGGGLACVSPSSESGGENCGQFNGEYVCISSFSEPGCRSTASGGIACVVVSGGANTGVAVPQTATGPATPTGTLSQGGTTVNYYSSSVVSTSVTAVPVNGQGTGSSSTGTGSSTSSSPTAGAIGDAVAESISECTGASCDAAGTLPALEELGTYGAIMQDFITRLRATPILQAALNVGATFPAGQCPHSAVPVLGIEVDFGSWACGVFDDTIYPMLSVIMIALWSFIGLRIIISA
jgi:hypothetical protein